MTIALELEELETLPSTLYRWDADTGILSAESGAPVARAGAGVAGVAGVAGATNADGAGGSRWQATAAARVAACPGEPRCEASGSVSVEGDDGSWLTLDLVDGCVQGVQVAVWPRVRRRSALSAPGSVAGRVRFRPSVQAGGVGCGVPARGDTVSVEVSARLVAEVGGGEGCIHFILGGYRTASVIAIASGILLELDSDQRLGGLWLLDVPPPPAEWRV